MIRAGLLWVVIAAAGWAQNWPGASAFSFDSAQDVHGDADYQQGLSELDGHQWEQAVRSFGRSAARGKANADAALYWAAYGLDRAGRPQEALDAIAHLREKYPASRWLKDARALEVEVRAQTGSPVSPNSEPDADLKLIAVNSLMMSNPSVALPVVEKVLTSAQPDGVKEQALFVLSQNSSPQADRLLQSIANRGNNPALQIQAIRIMGMMGNEEARKSLRALYGLSPDLQVKLAILQSFVQSGSRDFVEHAAKTELNPELRASAVRSLGMMGHDANTGQTLAAIYEQDRNKDVREAAIDALCLQQNGKVLIELAKREKGPQMKKAIVSRMAIVPSKEVTDYLIEILK